MNDSTDTIEVANWDKLPADPVVSVIMLAYQHEDYIAQAIDSVISQKCDCLFEVVIGEDCSPDHTGDIVRKYQKRYPHLVRILTDSTNVGISANAERCWNACRGKYIAICEGDDYWTDTDKLNVQVSALEKHKAAVLTFHDATEVDTSGDVINQSKIFRITGSVSPSTLTSREMISGHFIPTLSVMHRRKPGVPPPYPLPVVNGDNYLFAHLAVFGNALFIDRNMAAYRQHPGGAWSSRGKESRVTEHLRTYIAIAMTMPDSHLQYAIVELRRRTVTALTYFLVGYRSRELCKLCLCGYKLTVISPLRSKNLLRGILTSVTSSVYPFWGLTKGLLRYVFARR